MKDLDIKRMEQRHRRHWRLVLALRADRIERRLGRRLTKDELQHFDDLQTSDRLELRKAWLKIGGWLEVRDGRLALSVDRDRSKRRSL